jgi:hypothetical protein
VASGVGHFCGVPPLACLLPCLPAPACLFPTFFPNYLPPYFVLAYLPTFPLTRPALAKLAGLLTFYLPVLCGGFSVVWHRGPGGRELHASLLLPCLLADLPTYSACPCQTSGLLTFYLPVLCGGFSVVWHRGPGVLRGHDGLLCCVMHIAVVSVWGRRGVAGCRLLGGPRVFGSVAVVGAVRPWVLERFTPPFFWV